MQIENIEVINLIYQYPVEKRFGHSGGVCTGRLTTLVRVDASDGKQGLGAAYSYPELVRLIIEQHLAPHVMGEDPRDTESLWDKMYTLTRWYGRKGGAISALGALDMAFWDLRAKDADQPLYRLLGGNDGKVPAYASGLLWVNDVSELEAEAERHRQEGFIRAKTRFGHSEDYDMAALEAIQRGLGSDGQLIVDGSHRYPLDKAIWLGEILSKRDVFWFEEPFSPEAIDDYSALCGRVEIPITAGENDFGVQGFRELLRAKAINIAQPDACRTGGITASMRVGEMAAKGGVRIAPHTWSDAVALTANAHVVAALPNGVTVEVDRTGNPFIDDLLAEPIRVEDGLLTLSDAPGLGIDLNMDTVNALRHSPDEPIPDGSYSDLIFGADYYAETPPYGNKHMRDFRQ